MIMQSIIPLFVLVSIHKLGRKCKMVIRLQFRPERILRSEAIGFHFLAIFLVAFPHSSSMSRKVCLEIGAFTDVNFKFVGMWYFPKYTLGAYTFKITVSRMHL